MEWKNSELFGDEKRGGKIYVKALRRLLKRTEDSESRPGLYAAFVRVCQSIHTMLHTTDHQHNSMVNMLTLKRLYHRPLHIYCLQSVSIVGINNVISRSVIT